MAKAPRKPITVTCGPHISSILAHEVKALGYPVEAVKPTSVELWGTLEDCMKLNLHLRTANRVLWRVGNFKAGHPDQLYQALSRIPWEDYIPHKGYFSVNGFVKNKHILDTRFANQKTKDAIVDRLQRLRKQRPDSGPKRDRTMLYLFWVKDLGQIYLDTSGETISKHGYRKIPFKAPLREALAAAILLASQWKPGQSLVSPMCGSGTLTIEAAMMTMHMAPGLLRSNFGFMHIKGYESRDWKRLCQEAKEAINLVENWHCVASDHSLEALRSARINAQQAGVDKWIKFEHKDFRQTTIPPAPGAVIINPEYGDRLGEVERLQATYKQIGDFFKEKCAGYWGYVFTGNPELGKQIGLRTKRKLPFFNGQLECRLLEYELYSGSKKKTTSMGDKG